jgi:hypothetical protein
MCENRTSLFIYAQIERQSNEVSRAKVVKLGRLSPILRRTIRELKECGWDEQIFSSKFKYIMEIFNLGVYRPIILISHLTLRLPLSTLCGTLENDRRRPARLTDKNWEEQ